jgi:hypothetical protein
VQVVYTFEELLESAPVEEPLLAGGVRCHGGFDGDGNYVSPRTKNRGPAIRAWQEQHRQQFGRPLLDIALDTWPPAFPNVAQAACLIRNGVPEPIIATLTRIGTVEGFGSMIRHSPIPDLPRCFAEDIDGTATAHLGHGLYEAHARDEAGFGDEGGHKQMWFAARDIAFEHPVTEDQTEAMLARMFPTKNGTPVAPPRLFPELDADLEQLIERMARLLLIEISAYHTFAWAEELLSDDDLVAGDGDAARLVSYVRADEAPHVEYLKTTLSEMRDRTFVTARGGTIAGTTVVGGIWERAKEESLGVRREEQRRVTEREIEHALDGHPRRAEILAEVAALAG